MNRTERPYYHIWDSLLARPKELVIRAQIHLIWLRRGLRFIQQKEWDNLTEAIAVLEQALKLQKEKK